MALDLVERTGRPAGSSRMAKTHPRWKREVPRRLLDHRGLRPRRGAQPRHRGVKGRNREAGCGAAGGQRIPRRLAQQGRQPHLPQPARRGPRLEWHDSSRNRAGDPAVSGLSSLSACPMAGSSHHATGPPRRHGRSAGASRRPAKSPELNDACSPSPAQRWQTSKAREHAMWIGLPGARRARVPCRERASSRRGDGFGVLEERAVRVVVLGAGDQDW
jgi:hypothetical protein